jgi:hypothetical protein
VNQAIFEQFASLLNTRLSNAVITTEDSVRYSFYAAILYSGILQPHEMIMEFPHPEIPNAEVDTYIPAKESNLPEVFELKYHRQVPNGKNSPRP